MNYEMEARVNGSTNQAVCALLDNLEALDKKNCGGEIHYGCAFVIRGDKVFHLCTKSKTEWEVK